MTRQEPQLPGSFVPIKREGLLAEEVDGQLIVLDPESGAARVLNTIGLAVWMLIDGTRDLASMVRTLSEEAAAEEEIVRADVSRFLRALAEAGLLAA